LDRVTALRDEGVPAYATIDAGPNVVVWCDGAAADLVAAAVKEISVVESVAIARSGPGARLVEGPVAS
jgi:diphosphomevalonate decarboxylase